MSSSEARIAANRANAQKSTGPTTEAGKAASRRNSLQHGLTGAGVVVPGEDAAEVDRRRAAFEAELAPGRSATALMLAQRVAALSVRLDRSVRHDSAATAARVEAALAAARAARAEEALACFAAAEADPAGHRDALLALPAGVDLLLDTLGSLGAALRPGASAPRDDARTARLAGLVPGPDDAATAGRLAALARDSATDDPAARAEFAAAVAAAIGRLEAHRATFDPAELEAADARTASLALVAADPAAVLVQKYEAATERSIFRALRELRPYQAVPPQPVDPAPTRAALAENLAHLDLDLAPPADPRLGSFFPASGPGSGPRGAAEVAIARPPARPQSRYEDRKKRPRPPR